MKDARMTASGKRILVTTTHFAPHIGGVEHYTRDFFSALKKQYPNTEITVVTLGQSGSPKRETLLGLDIVRIPAFGPDINPLFSPWTAGRILRELRVETYDVVLTQCRYYFFTAWLYYVLRKKKVPRLHIEHNAGYMSHPNFLVSFFARCYERSVGVFILKRTERIVAVSESVRSFLRESFGVSATVCYGGIDTTRWNGRTGESESVGGKTKFIFCGRLIREKGIYILLEAFFILCKKYPESELLYLGTGPEELNLRKQVEHLGLSGKVFVLGRKNANDIQALYEETPIFVNPSMYTEGLQIALLEAAASELPIVTTSVGGVRELFQDKVNAIIVDEGLEALVVALEYLVGHRDLAVQMGKAARKTIVEKCDLRVSTRRFYEYVFEI